jgi:Zn-dependent metalloprotease
MLVLSASSLLLTGCATAPQPRPELIDAEPILVGKPIVERLNQSSVEISNQLTLLKSLQNGGRIGSFSVVTHNNNLDARIGSSETIPAAYGKLNQVQPQAVKVTQIVKTENVKTEPVTVAKKEEKIIKKIEWSNNSLNTLITNFSNALKYDVVITPSKKKVTDLNVNFKAENITVLQGLELLKKQLNGTVDIVVMERNKTINVFYK